MTQLDEYYLVYRSFFLQDSFLFDDKITFHFLPVIYPPLVNYQGHVVMSSQIG